MIHKFWVVKLHPPNQPYASDRRSLEGAANEEERQKVRYQEEQVEQKVLRMWRTLSQFEEKSASCISDMLLFVSNGAVFDGTKTAKRFIVHVQLLFRTTDSLDRLMSSRLEKGRHSDFFYHDSPS